MRSNEVTDSIISDCAAGDVTALVALYNAYSANIAAYIAYLIHDDFSAEDLMMEIFEGLPEALKSHDPFTVESFNKWLLCVAKNRSYNFLRRKATRKEVSFDESIMSAKTETYSEFRISELKTYLSEEEYRFLVLRFVEDCSLKEIAEEMNLTVDQVKKRSVKILDKVKTFYEFYYETCN